MQGLLHQGKKAGFSLGIIRLHCRYLETSLQLPHGEKTAESKTGSKETKNEASELSKSEMVVAFPRG